MKPIPQPYIVTLAAVLVTIALLVLFLYHLKIVMVPLLFAIVFSVMIFPFCSRFEKWGLSKGIAAFFAVFIFTAVLSSISYILFAQLSIFTDHIPQISARLNVILNQIRDFAAQKLNMKRLEVGNRIQAEISLLQNSSISAGSIGTLSSFLINVFLVPLYVFFILYFRDFFIDFFYRLFKNADKIIIDATFMKMGKVIKGYLFGQLLDILIIGTANAAALYLIGVGYPVVLGFGIAVLCIIPYLGMIAGSLVAVLVALITTGSNWQPLTALSVLWIIHIIDSNLVTPLVIGSRVSLNPLIAIFVLFLFGELWGLPGLFLALPLTAIMKVIFDAVPGLQAYGFLLGEPEKYHLKKNSYLHIKMLQRLVEIRKQKPIIESLPGEITAD